MASALVGDVGFFRLSESALYDAIKHVIPGTAMPAMVLPVALSGRDCGLYSNDVQPGLAGWRPKQYGAWQGGLALQLGPAHQCPSHELHGRRQTIRRNTDVFSFAFFEPERVVSK